MVDHRRAGCEAGGSERAGGRHRPQAADGDLPLSLTDLIGRKDDVVALRNLVSYRRLVTVVGPGGVGKSRLAQAVASGSAPAYRHGARLADIDGVGSAAGVWARVAVAIGLVSAEARVSPERVVAHLRNRELLLLLDNCEHLTSECRAVAFSVTRACPDVSFLVTSRQALGVAGERLWPLAGLGVDGGASPAVRLFVERAEAQRPDFALNPEESLVVAELCRRLDGLPLAIELAAGRVRVLAPVEILARIDDRFSLLIGGSTAVPARHRSLRASLEWSHDLLSLPESVLFRRLSVFAGSFTLDAAEAVCASPPLRGENALDVIASLVATSLVTAETAGDETRYRLLESTRADAAGRLVAAGEAVLVQERHAEWCLSLVQEAERNVRGPQPAPWLARMAAEHDNVEAALEWAVRSGRTERALGIAAAMAVFWRKWDRYGTGTRWLAKALALPGQPDALRVEALLGQGLLLGESGDRRGAVGPLEEALQLAEDRGDAGAEARALNLLGYFRLFVDVPTTALPSLERSTARARAAGDRRTLLESLSAAGLVAMFGGDARVADARYGACLALAEGDERRGLDTWAALVGLGWAALTQGRLLDAEISLTEALQVADRTRSRHARAVVWCFQGQLARAQGDYDRAGALLAVSLAKARETASPFAVPVRLALLGGVANDRGDLERAEAAMVEAAAVVTPDLPFAQAQCLVALGGLRVTQGQADEGAALLDAGFRVAGAHGLRGVMSTALLEQARLRRLSADLHHAARLATRAIDLQHQLSDIRGLVESLEVLAGIRAGQGRGRMACRLFGAADMARRNAGLVRAAVRAVDYEGDVAVAKRGLDPREWDSLWAGGASLSPAGAAALAVSVQGRRDFAGSGWDAITPAEREVVALVAQGLTNREAAERLVVSSRTVETHVAHVLAKVGIGSRRELARVAAAKGFR